MKLYQSKRPFVNVFCGVAILLAVAVYCPSAYGAVLFEDNFNYAGTPDSAKWDYSATSGASAQANGSYAEFSAAGDSWVRIGSKESFSANNTVTFEYRRDSNAVTGGIPTIWMGHINADANMDWLIEMSWQSGTSQDKILFETTQGGTRNVRANVWIDPDVWYRIVLVNSETAVTASVYKVSDNSEVFAPTEIAHDTYTTALNPQPIYFRDSGYPTIAAFGIDNVQVIPEPATMAMLGLGGIGMLIRRRR